MKVVREKDISKMLTVSPDSLSETAYEEAILAILERQQNGAGKVIVNMAGTVHAFGEKPERVWTNERMELLPYIEARNKHRALFKEKSALADEETYALEAKVSKQDAEIAALHAQMAEMMKHLKPATDAGHSDAAELVTPAKETSGDKQDPSKHGKPFAIPSVPKK
jgi:hypothetical protein